MLTLSSVKRLIESMGEAKAGNAVATDINSGSALAAASAFAIPAMIVATATSTTTDFGALKIGDIVIHVPATAGNAAFFTVAAAGTLPAAAVVGDLYAVVRAFTAPAASAVKL